MKNESIIESASRDLRQVLTDFVMLRDVPFELYKFAAWIKEEKNNPTQELEKLTPAAFDEDSAKQPGESFDNWLTRKLHPTGGLVSLQVGDCSTSIARLIESLQRPIKDLTVNQVENLSLNKKRIRSIVIYNAATINLSRCYVDKLFLYGDTYNVVIQYSWIGTLTIGKPGPQSLAIGGGGVITFDCRSTDQPLLRGAMSLINVHIPRRRLSWYGVKIQPLRDLRVELTKLHNGQTAGKLHAVELSLTREGDPVAAKIVGCIYELLCDFGNSIGRPITWFFGLWFCAWLIGWISGGIQFVEGPAWAAAASEPLKAAIYPLSNALNPLSVFNAKPLFAASSFQLAGLLSIFSLGMLVSAAMFFVALRRRFKLE